MEQENKQENRFEETMIEGRNAVLEAFRSGKTVDKLFVLDGCQDGPVKTITREAKKQNTTATATPLLTWALFVT